MCAAVSLLYLGHENGPVPHWVPAQGADDGGRQIRNRQDLPGGVGKGARGVLGGHGPPSYQNADFKPLAREIS